MEEKQEENELKVEDEDEIARELESMDIDTDFNVWESFQKSLVLSKESIAPDAPDEKDTEDNQKGAERGRLHRDEIYSRFYVPTEEEQKEKMDLLATLGLNNNWFSSIPLLGGPKHDEQQLELVDMLLRSDSLNNKKESQNQNIVNEGMDVDTTIIPRSILLKRGPVLWNDQERELILLTHGILLANIHQEKKKIRLSFDLCRLLQSISYVVDRECCPDPVDGNDEKDGQESYVPFGLSIRFSNKDIWNIVFAKNSHKKEWIHAFQKTLMPMFIRTLPSEDRNAGWQHTKLRTGTNALYSSAVLGDLEMMKRVMSLYPDHDIDALDPYGHNALHYAVMYDKLDCVQELLQSHADPTALDKNGTSALSHAEGLKSRNILIKHGYTEHMTSKENLFGVHNKKDEQSADDDDQPPPSPPVSRTPISTPKILSKVTGMMSGAMSAMAERGEKIKALDTKTAKMKDEAEDYKDMASQLKENMKKRDESLFGLWS